MVAPVADDSVKEITDAGECRATLHLNCLTVFSDSQTGLEMKTCSG